jgi:2-iminobutanoate/2-iminopropanoate deaminase
MTGGISGTDLTTGKVPEDPIAQVAQAFDNLERILEAAGATVDDLVKVDVTLKTMALRDEINVQWLKRFPEEHSRPARHTKQYDHFRGGVAVQLEAIAVIT